MKTVARVNAVLEITITLDQYGNSWKIEDLRREARMAALHRLKELLEKATVPIKLVEEPKIAFVVTEAT